MAGQPTDYVGKRALLAQPWDENSKVAPVLMGAIVDPATKGILGYLPVKCYDNGDGTCSLSVYFDGIGGNSIIGMTGIFGP